ncbi:MAG: DUF2096 family protein [Candidatus Bathycorpusculaceae bacterium]
MVTAEMGYMAAWKVLEEMITDFRKKGLTVPAKVMDDLKFAKTLIKVLKADPTRGETTQKIEEYLGNVESYLISEGERNFGIKYVDGWLKRLDEAGKKLFDEEEAIRFVPGLPREQKWIRLKPSAELSLEKLKSIAEELNLSYNVQSDGYLLIYGEEGHIKEFVKKVATK